MQKQVNIYVPEELLERIDRLARNDDRSRSATVLRMVRYYLVHAIGEKHWWNAGKDSEDDPQARLPFA
ncbi:MAG: CopG family transcriptional regulator [Planctomycetes bacterium]|nr:CopG family transcriptional regulator [Planctomycetota bacterium]